MSRSGESLMGVTNKDVNQLAHDINPRNIYDSLNPITQITNAIKGVFAVIIVTIMLIFFLVMLFRKNEHACTMSKKIAGAC